MGSESISEEPMKEPEHPFEPELSGEHLAQTLAASDIKGVDTILGATPPAVRTGDLALNTPTQLGATLVIAKGCVTPGDGGGGIFYWDATSLPDDGGTNIAPADGGGVWRRVYTGALSVKWFGAVGDG